MLSTASSPGDERATSRLLPGFEVDVTEALHAEALISIAGRPAHRSPTAR